MLVSIHVCVLHNVFRFHIIVQDSFGHPIKAPVVAAHQEFVQRGLTSQYTVDYLFVAPVFLPCSFNERRTSHFPSPFLGLREKPTQRVTDSFSLNGSKRSHPLPTGARYRTMAK